MNYDTGLSPVNVKGNQQNMQKKQSVLFSTDFKLIFP